MLLFNHSHGTGLVYEWFMRELSAYGRVASHPSPNICGTDVALDRLSSAANHNIGMHTARMFSHTPFQSIIELN
jgi:hypothetical protein